MYTTITDQELQEILQGVSDKLENLDTIKALISASLADFAKRRTVEGELTHEQQLRAVARYCYLLGYGIALTTTQAALDEEAKEQEGDFILCVDSDGLAPTFHRGDVLTIRPAQLTAEALTRSGTVIHQDGRNILGRVIELDKDGGILFNGSGPVSFVAGDVIGYAIAVQRPL